MLSARNLFHSFGAERLLEDVSLDVIPGQIVSLLGPSGSGKSTLLRILALLDQPDRGLVSLDGRPLLTGTASKRAKKQSAQGWGAVRGARRGAVRPPWPEITLVFQQQFLWPHLSVAQNLLLPLGARARTKRTHLLEELELERLTQKRPWQLSQGERARAALARALLLEPRFLLLDEVTAALDSVRASAVGRLLRIAADGGTGILFVTHDTERALEWSDSILRLEAGTLQAPRTVPSLTARQAYSSP